MSDEFPFTLNNFLHQVINQKKCGKGTKLSPRSLISGNPGTSSMQETQLEAFEKLLNLSTNVNLVGNKCYCESLLLKHLF